MNERGSHIINVRIGLDKINIDSELQYGNPTRPVEKGTETYGSVEEAKKKLDSLQKLYQKFASGYQALVYGELALLLASVGKGFGDLTSAGDFGGDLLRILGVIGIGIVTITAESMADDNKTKAKNKLLA